MIAWRAGYLYVWKLMIRVKNRVKYIMNFLQLLRNKEGDRHRKIVKK